MDTFPIARYWFFQQLDPKSILKKISTEYADGHLKIFSPGNSWSLYIEEKKIVYGCYHHNMLDILSTKISELSKDNTRINTNTVRNRLRKVLNSNDLEQKYHGTGSKEALPPQDYLAICWLVNNRYITASFASLLIEEICLDIVKVFIEVEQGSYEFLQETPLLDLPKFRYVDWRLLMERSQNNIGLIDIENLYVDIQEKDRSLDTGNSEEISTTQELNQDSKVGQEDRDCKLQEKDIQLQDENSYKEVEVIVESLEVESSLKATESYIDELKDDGELKEFSMTSEAEIHHQDVERLEVENRDSSEQVKSEKVNKEELIPPGRTQIKAELIQKEQSDSKTDNLQNEYLEDRTHNEKYTVIDLTHSVNYLPPNSDYKDKNELGTSQNTNSRDKETNILGRDTGIGKNSIDYSKLESSSSTEENIQNKDNSHDKTASDGNLKKDNVNPSKNQKKYTIICIDDSPAVLSAIKHYLDDQIFKVVDVKDPLKALTKIIRFKPDIILLDIGMPTIDGYELCSLLRKHYYFKETPVIMVTGRTGFIDRAKAKLVRASGYLTKPFSKSDLLKIIFQHISVH